jgi:hypothetical protein
VALVHKPASTQLEDIMPSGSENHGIYVTGQGSIDADQIAVGSHARAQKVVLDAGIDLDRRGWAEVHQKLDQLFEATREKACELKNGTDVMSAVQHVAEELKCDNPSRLTLKSLLDGIAEHAGSVTKIVTAAGALKAAVMATLG